MRGERAPPRIVAAQLVADDNLDALEAFFEAPSRAILAVEALAAEEGRHVTGPDRAALQFMPLVFAAARSIGAIHHSSSSSSLPRRVAAAEELFHRSARALASAERVSALSPGDASALVDLARARADVADARRTLEREKARVAEHDRLLRLGLLRSALSDNDARRCWHHARHAIGDRPDPPRAMRDAVGVVRTDAAVVEVLRSHYSGVVEEIPRPALAASGDGGGGGEPAVASAAAPANNTTNPPIPSASASCPSPSRAASPSPASQRDRGPFSWGALMRAAKGLSLRKASGDDGVPDAFFKAMRKIELRHRRAFSSEHRREAPDEPLSGIGVFAFSCVRDAWLYPSELASANVGIVHPIPKRDADDPLDPSSLRPITVINSLFKLANRIAASDLRASLAGRLSVSQAAFVGKEECEAQAFALLEIASRRFVKLGRPTYVAFLDIRKAFDTVPHWALAEALAQERFGVNPDTARFVLGQYRSPGGDAISTSRVKFAGTLSAPFTVGRGIRQGFPESPLLFNAAIDDFLDGVAGVVVPGLQDRARGLLFADDAAIFGETRAAVVAGVESFRSRLDAMGMQLNASKSAALVLFGTQAPNYLRGPDGVLLRVAPRRPRGARGDAASAATVADGGVAVSAAADDEADDAAAVAAAAAPGSVLVEEGSPQAGLHADPLPTRDELIPTVDAESYLGVVIPADGNLHAHAAARASKGFAALRRWFPIVCDRSLPVSFRRDVVACAVLPAARHGQSLLGLHSAAGPIAATRAVDRAAVAAMLGTSGATRPALSAGLAELGLPSAAADAARAVTRMVAKAPSSDTLIRPLVATAGTVRPAPDAARRRDPLALYQGTARLYSPLDWPRLYLAKPCFAEAMLEPAPKRRGKLVLAVETAREQEQSAPAPRPGERPTGGFRYFSRGLHASRPRGRYTDSPGAVAAQRALSRARLNGTVVARRLGFRAEEVRRSCPACRGMEGNPSPPPDTIAHLLVDCRCYDAERESTGLVHVGRRAALALTSGDRSRYAGSRDTPRSAPTTDNVATLLIGGEVDGRRFRSWDVIPSAPTRVAPNRTVGAFLALVEPLHEARVHAALATAYAAAAGGGGG